MGTILIVILILMLVGVLPTWPHSKVVYCYLPIVTSDECYVKLFTRKRKAETSSFRLKAASLKLNYGIIRKIRA